MINCLHIVCLLLLVLYWAEWRSRKHWALHSLWLRVLIYWLISQIMIVIWLLLLWLRHQILWSVKVWSKRAKTSIKLILLLLKLLWEHRCWGKTATIYYNTSSATKVTGIPWTVYNWLMRIKRGHSYIWMLILRHAQRYY